MRLTQKSKEVFLFLIASILFYLFIVFFFAWLYIYTDSIGFSNLTDLRFKPNYGEAIYFSANSFHTIGYGDIHPVSGTGRLLVMIEAFTSLLFIAIFSGFLVYLVIHRYSDIISTKSAYIRFRNDKYFLSIRLGNKGRAVIDLKSKFEAWTIVDNTRVRLFQHEQELPDLERILYYDIDLLAEDNQKLTSALRDTIKNKTLFHMKFSFIGNDIRTGEQVAYAKYYDTALLKFGTTFSNVYSWDVNGHRTNYRWKNFERIDTMKQIEIDNFLHPSPL
jgi:hypothetical protein